MDDLNPDKKDTMTRKTKPRAERLIEEGAAFLELSAEGATKPLEPRAEQEHFDVIIIGAGQAGLSAGYYLKKRGFRFLIVDGSERVGDTWRKRWDSLRLFTPAKFNGIAGMPFPAPGDYFPTKDEMADYLEKYAEHFELPVRNGLQVSRLFRDGDRYVVEAGGRQLSADQVVVAMANYQKKHVPDFARQLHPEIVQIHSADYRNPSQLQRGNVLIVGAGNSGAEIAKELSHEHRVHLSGRDVGQIPFRTDGLAGRLLLVRLVLRFVFHRLLTIRTPVGRKVRPKVLHQGGPLIRVKSGELSALGVERAPRVVGVHDGMPRLADGRVLDVQNVVWCTGFHPGFSWIDLPIFDELGDPRHTGGIVEDVPGLYFVGLHFLYSLSSTMIHGVSRDAARIVEAIAARRADGRSVSAPAGASRRQTVEESVADSLVA